MQAIVAAIGTMLLAIAPSLVGRVLVGLGVGVATYTGVTVLLDGVSSLIESQFAAMPIAFDQAVNVLGFMNVDIAITIITSAVAARAAMRGLLAASGGTVRNLTF